MLNQRNATRCDGTLLAGSASDGGPQRRLPLFRLLGQPSLALPANKNLPGGVSTVCALAVMLCFLTAAAFGQSPGGAGGAASEPATQPALSAHNLELLRDLETGDWHSRKKAEAELADRDSADEPILQAMLARAANPEAKARLAQALATMHSNGALGPSRITLHVKDAPADQVYADIFRQARAKLKPMSADLFTHPAIAPLTIDVDRQPFWAVMEQLYPKTGLMIVEISPGDFRLARTDGIPGGPRVTNGPILIVATQVQAAVSEANPPPPANPAIAMMMARHQPPRIGFGLVMTAYIEPRIKVLKMSPMVLIDQATDDNGNSLLSEYWARLASGIEVSPTDAGWPQLTARLKFPQSNPGKRIAVLRGSAMFDLLLETGKLEIPSILTAGPSEFSINDKPVKFLGCKKVGNDYWVQFRSTYGKDDPWDMNVFESQPSMRLLDANGHGLVNTGPAPQQTLGTLGDHTIVFKPTALPGGRSTGEPSKLEWSYPAKTHEVIVQIEFRDLDMNFQGQ